MIKTFTLMVWLSLTLALQPGVAAASQHAGGYEPPHPPTPRAEVSVSKPAQSAVAASLAGDRLSRSTVAVRLYRTGIALDWQLDLEQKPTELAGVCQQVILTWDIGPIRAAHTAWNDADRIGEVLRSGGATVNDMNVRRRFRRLKEGEHCTVTDTAHWISAERYSEFAVVSGWLDRLRALEACGGSDQVRIYCRDATGFPCSFARARLHAFLQEEISAVAMDGGAQSADRRDGRERLIMTFGSNGIETAEVLVMGPPPLN